MGTSETKGAKEEKGMKEGKGAKRRQCGRPTDVRLDAERPRRVSRGATLIVRLEREAADVPQVSKRAWAWQGVSDVSYLVRRRQPTTACRPTAALERIDAT